MTTIPRNVEKALADWLVQCGNPSLGGLMLFRTQEGNGGLLEIRRGHDEGEMPEAGVVIVHCDEAQREVIGVNGFRCQAQVELRYPTDSYSDDPRNVPAFTFIADEISYSLMREDLFANLNDKGKGVWFHGYVEGLTCQTEVKSTRGAIWELQLMVSADHQFKDLNYEQSN